MENLPCTVPLPLGRFRLPEGRAHWAPGPGLFFPVSSTGALVKLMGKAFAREAWWSAPIIPATQKAEERVAAKAVYEDWLRIKTTKGLGM